MIRYPYDAAQFAADVASIDRRWFFKAQQRTAAIIAQGHYAEESSIWSIIKPVFMRLQHNKCVYCERQFENPEYGTIEFDLEHFRPKSSVAAWPDAHRHPNLRYAFATGAPSENGYFWLAYNLLNYAASCKVCNTIFKLDFFPIAGARALPSLTGELPAVEQSMLCYPIGTGDTDPEELVTFDITTAIPAQATDLEQRRGEIIIDFFGLNLRDQLHTERARMICLVGSLLQTTSSGGDHHPSEREFSVMMSPQLPHAACIRAFYRLWHSDRLRAEQGLEKCRSIVLGT